MEACTGSEDPEAGGNDGDSGSSSSSQQDGQASSSSSESEDDDRAAKVKLLGLSWVWAGHEGLLLFCVTWPKPQRADVL